MKYKASQHIRINSKRDLENKPSSNCVLRTCRGKLDFLIDRVPGRAECSPQERALGKEQIATDRHGIFKSGLCSIQQTPAGEA